MSESIKAGDKVTFNSSPEAQAVHEWRRAAGRTPIHKGDVFTIVEGPFDRSLWHMPDTVFVIGPGMEGGETWEVAAFDLVHQDVTVPATAPAKTAVKTLLDAKLYPQDKTVLAHLKTGKPLTPMKALTIYGFTRLAAQVRNIRLAGYNVAMTMKQDEVGHKYAEYRLA